METVTTINGNINAALIPEQPQEHPGITRIMELQKLAVIEENKPGKYYWMDPDFLAEIGWWGLVIGEGGNEVKGFHTDTECIDWLNAHSGIVATTAEQAPNPEATETIAVVPEAVTEALDVLPDLNTAPSAETAEEDLIETDNPLSLLSDEELRNQIKEAEEAYFVPFRKYAVAEAKYTAMLAAFNETNRELIDGKKDAAKQKQKRRMS